jgi:RNA polymerase sigma-70 factor (ECF subfamily)
MGRTLNPALRLPPTAHMDEELVVAATPEQAVRLLYQRHAKYIRNAIAHLAGPGLDHEDLLQDVFTTALRRWSTFAGRAQPRTWLYAVAIRTVANARRKSKVRRFFGMEQLDEVQDELPADAPNPEQVASSQQDRKRVYAALDRLSEKHRTVLVLHALEGLTGEEIAAAVDCPVKTVWTRLFHARKEFKRHHAELVAVRGGAA